jgi:hypothetical protein
MWSACSGNYQDDYENPDDGDTQESSVSDFAGSGARADTGRYEDALAVRYSDASGSGATGKLQETSKHWQESYEVLVSADRIVEIRIVHAKCFQDLDLRAG